VSYVFKILLFEYFWVKSVVQFSKLPLILLVVLKIKKKNLGKSYLDFRPSGSLWTEYSQFALLEFWT